MQHNKYDDNGFECLKSSLHFFLTQKQFLLTRMRCYIDIWSEEFDTCFNEKCCFRNTDSKRKMDSISVSKVC